MHSAQCDVTRSLCCIVRRAIFDFGLRLLHRSEHRPSRYTRAELVEATQRANAYQFITETEDGFDTRTGEKGVLLSGGQKQRSARGDGCFRAERGEVLDLRLLKW